MLSVEMLLAIAVIGLIFAFVEIATLSRRLAETRAALDLAEQEADEADAQAVMWKERYEDEAATVANVTIRYPNKKA